MRDLRQERFDSQILKIIKYSTQAKTKQKNFLIGKQSLMLLQLLFNLILNFQQNKLRTQKTKMKTYNNPQNIQMTNLTSKLFVFLLFLSLLRSQDSIPAMQHKKVVQANHYYSDSDLSVNYTIQNVEKGRALIFVLRNKTSSEASFPVEKNHINITLKTKDERSECLFDSYDDLCVIKEIQETANMTLEIKCQKLPCDLSWTIFQPIAKKPADNQTLQDLYELSNTQKHMIAIISCNDPSITSFQQDVKIYSDNPFTSTFSNNVFYYLFNNEKKGFMFAQVAMASRVCAQMRVYNVQYDVKVNEKASLRDFVRNDSLSVFKLSENPSTDFMIDASVHELDKTQVMKSGLEIKVTGETSGNRETLQQYTIRPFGEKTQFPFKYIVKKIDQKYKNIQIELKSTGNVIMINFVITPENRQELETGEISYFHLLNGQKLLYKVPTDPEASQDKKVYIYYSNKNLLSANETECKLKTGCQFELVAKGEIQASLYLGESHVENKEEVVVGELKKEVSKKGRESEVHYFKTALKAKKALQLVVNSPNVIIYTSTQGHCPSQPSKACYQKVFNYHNPVIYEPQKDTTLYLSVQVLDNCLYSLTRIDQDDEYIDLKDGQSFSYLMDDQEDKVIFKFKIDKKQPVSFNLISPLNSLYLLVQNGKKVPSSKEMNIASTDGYISFTKNQVKQLEFTILIKKTEDYNKKFVHFTLIASTNTTNMRLEPGIPHYQTLKPEQTKVYAFEFSPKQEYIVSFYTHNAKAKQKVNLQMMVNNNDEWTKVDPNRSFVIDQASDVLQLKDVSQALCASQGTEQCAIFVKLINTMDSEVDLTLNLMVKNSIIQLKDGIWQSYAENAIATSSNFYFYPKHENKSVEIMYRSVFTDLRIAYAVWKADDKNIDPTEWPFPKIVQKESKQNKITSFRPTKHISIDPSALKQCWPSCVILIALIKNSTQVHGQFQTSYLQNGQFSIMASNNYIQIPQKTKVDVVLKQNQSKYFMIDLKYVLEKEESAVTLFTTSTIGYYEIKGSLYSEKNPKCPSEEDESEFKFGNLETQIKVATILKKLQQNDMGDDRNVYLCLLTKAYTNTKLSFQYTSDEDSIKVLDMDSFETVNVDKEKAKMYQISANQEYYVKFTRNKGFPFVKFAKCTEGDDYEKCLEDLESSKQKGKQLVSKTESFSEEPCAKCIIFIKISSEEPAEVDIHLQSKYTEMQLKQNKMVSDFTNQNQQNRYSILALRNEQTIINIQITEGMVEAHVTDFGNININKTNQKDKNMIHIVIPAQDHQQKRFDKSLELLGAAWMTSFGLSDTFSSLHLTIKALNGKAATAYTVTYSSGERQTYLQDGLIMDYVLEPEKETTFFYENTNSEGHGYLSISMDNSANLHNLNLKMYYLVDPKDEDTAVEIAAEMPPMRKRTPNPTVLYSIPAQNFIVIKMKNPSNAEQKVSLGINHQEVILLPFNHEFPFPLHKKQSINLLIDVNNPGYLKLTLRKCDQSNPQFSYTFDYEGFQKGEFTYTSILNEDPKFEYFIKVKEIGTLYVNIKSDDEYDSLMAIRAEYSEQKIKSSMVKPGNKGILEYQLLDSSTAELTFTEVVCGSSDSSCHKEFEYYTLNAVGEQELYSQTVCPSQYFATVETVSTNPLPMTKIKANPDSNGKITFQYTLMDHISYVGVKGINSKTGEEVYFRPVEIVTVWGQISRTSFTHRFTIIGIALCALAHILVLCRKHARRGYKPLEEDG